MKTPGKDEIINRTDHLLAGDPAALFRQDFVNARGTDMFTDEHLTDVIAAHLLENGFVEKLRALPPLPRSGDYLSTQRQEDPGAALTARREECFVKNLVGEELEQLGRCLDCLVPIGEDDDDLRLDLVCHAAKRNRLLLVEVKYDRSEDSLLQATLAIATRHQLLDRDRFLAQAARHLAIDPATLTLQPAIWTVKGKHKTGPGDIKLPYAFDEADGSRFRPHLCELIEKLGIEVYWGRDEPLKAKTMIL